MSAAEERVDPKLVMLNGFTAVQPAKTIGARKVTITKDARGIAVIPEKGIEVSITEGDTTLSFQMSTTLAEHLGQRIAEMAKE